MKNNYQTQIKRNVLFLISVQICGNCKKKKYACEFKFRINTCMKLFS